MKRPEMNQSRRVSIGQMLAVLPLFPKRTPAQELAEIGEVLEPPKSKILLAPIKSNYF